MSNDILNLMKKSIEGMIDKIVVGTGLTTVHDAAIRNVILVTFSMNIKVDEIFVGPNYLFSIC